jgi:IclR family transcriptional regulator, pca regulon regulatory protein
MPTRSRSDANAADPAEFGIDPADLIAGLGRGLNVVESFDDEHWRMTVADVAARTAIPRTAARRYLLSLRHFGYADSDGKHYWLTPRVLRLGQAYLEAARLPRLVRPFIQQASAATGETVNVSVLDGDDVLYVARSNSPRLVSIGFHAGARAPAHVVSPGPVLLAALKEPALAKWIEQHDFAAYTPESVTDRRTFLRQVRLAQAQGWWATAGQLDTGLTGVSMPLKDRRGRCIAAVGMTVQTVHWNMQRVATQLLPVLQSVAQDLRQIL